MIKALTLVSLLHLVLPTFSSPCAVFDAKFNLYAFGLGGKDWNAGTQDSWGSGGWPIGSRSGGATDTAFNLGSATDLTTSGRP
jgi:hypothetical protein